MKNFKIKKFISLICIFVFIGAFLSPIFGMFSTNINLKNDSVAVVSDYDEYTSNLVDSMKNATVTDFSSSYSYKEQFPIFAEHQTSSVLCWAYSASKVIETTLMIQMQKYYNFSEIATAYFAYSKGITSTINSFGSFSKFDTTIKQCGIVHESDFSNDNYFKVNETNASKFDYINDYADKSLPQNLIPIYLSSNAKFKESNNKENIIKHYLSNYGGLNIALPGGSMFRYDEYTGDWMFDTQTSQNEGKYIKDNHAVCLIGWNDNGFIGLNSWGVDDADSYEEVVIPYTIMSRYYSGEFKSLVSDDWLCGYDYYDNSKISLVSSSAEEFSTTILKNSEVSLKNVFCLTEDVNLVYNISNLSNFDSIYIVILKGDYDVTSNFTISYNDDNNNITINWAPADSAFASTSTLFGGGSYVIRVYEDVSLIATESFSMYTGSELSYIKLENNLSDTDEIFYSMMNNFATSDNTETYYIHYAGSYKLNMYLTDLGELKKMTGEPSVDNLVRIVEFSVYDEATNTFITEANNSYLTLQGNTSSTQNCYSLILRNLKEDYVGKLIRFKVNIFSPYYFSKCAQQFYLNFFVSGVEGVNASSNAYQISYVVDGGKNNASNINIYPQYVKDQMTSFVLFAPEKVGYVFDGWFLDSEFQTELTDSLISDEMFGNIVLYAKWIYNDKIYYTTNLSVSNIYNYDKTEKDLTGVDLTEMAGLTYGESIRFKTVFELEDDLINETFTFKYYFYVDGILVNEVDMIQSSDMGNVQEIYNVYFGGLNDDYLAFPNLVAGSHYVEVVAVVVVRHKFSITESVSMNILVDPKEINLVYDSNASIFIYDAQSHAPAVAFSGYYIEDEVDFSEVEFQNKPQTNFGQYAFKIVDITNSNYKINEQEKNQDYWLYINKKQLTLQWKNNSTIYNGRVQYPICEIIGVIPGDYVSVSLDNMGYVNAGDYVFEIKGLSNLNYSIPDNQKISFEIKPAPLVVKFHDVEERAQSAIVYRTQITFSVEGNLYDSKDSLKIVGDSLGLTKMVAGEYEITGTYDNSNYDIDFIPGIYLLTGYYYVYYTMPDGEIISELVNYGEEPKGIENLISVSKLQKIKYSTELVETGDDIYVVVTVKDYTWYVVIAAIILGFVVTYWFITRKIRRNKVR